MKRSFFKLIDLFYPKMCLTCAKVLIKYEEILCFYCFSQLPFTGFCDIKENEVERIFFGRVEIQNGTALLHYSKKGYVQKLIHALKYQGNQEVGSYLGRYLGEEIYLSRRFLHLDCIMPVPVSKQKRKKRGYNQLTEFGKELSKKLEISFIEDVLIMNSKTVSQTILGRIDRVDDLETKFILIDEKSLQNKHILLVDDVVTTGATLEACCIVLQKIKGVKISIALMAITD